MSGGTPVPDGALLWRRVSPGHVEGDGVRPSSAAFAAHPEDGKTSICVASIAGTPDAMMEGHDGYWLAEFTAAAARSVGFEIEVDDDNPPYPGHANLIWSGSGSKRKRAQKDLAVHCGDRWRIRGASSAPTP
jgi:hypothetical protein